MSRNTRLTRAMALHQAVAAHRLVHVHRMQARGVEACQPHVAHQHHAQRVGGVPEALRQRLAPRLVADVQLPVRRVRGGAGHHHLDGARLVAVVVPVGAQAHQLAVQVDADAPAHADNHRLAVHGLDRDSVEVHRDIIGNELQALVGADDGLELRPLGLEPLPAVDLLALGGFLEVWVDVRAFPFVERQPRRGGSRSRSAPSRRPARRAGCRRR